MNWILPVGIGVAVAALVLAAKKKNDEDELIRDESPGLPPASTMHPTGTMFPYITPRRNYFNV